MKIMEANLLSNLNVKQSSIEERLAAGKSLREKFPREMHCEYKPSEKRVDPVTILEEQAKTRLPFLVPIRYARMLASPFAFLRGSAAVMAADLANTTTTGITVQACGDMHVANFGVFGSVERNLVFGINDFDETLPGPWEWDLKRLATSAVVAGRFLGGNDKLCKESVMEAVKSYRTHMKQYANMGYLQLYYETIKGSDILNVISPSARKGAEKIFEKASKRTHMQVLAKLTDIVDNKNLLRVNSPFIVRETQTQSGRTVDEALGLVLESYFASLSEEKKQLLKHYSIVDVVRKVVGVGSVGTRCWVIFLKGNHDGDPLFLQAKEAQPSVLEPYIEKSAYSNHGQRVVAGQRILQAAPDIFIGWGELDGIHFYIRQLRDMKGGIEFDPNKVKVKNMAQYTTLCGWALALAHAKSGDAAMIAGYAGKGTELDKAITRFAFSYANQTEKDHRALAEAAKSGRINVAESSE
jgi:uncharacterized protein (DUF2252 family)